MKKIIYLLLLLVGFTTAAQVKIGANATSVGSSSALELESTNKAFLLPRVANTAAIANPVNGMVIFDISMQCVRGYENGAWTGCSLTTPSACVTPTVSAITSTGPITPGNTITFSITASNYTAVTWTLKNTSGTTLYSGNTLNTGALGFSTPGTYTISYIVTNATNGCTPTSTTVSGTETVSDYPCSLPTFSNVTGPTTIVQGGSGTFSVEIGNYHTAVWKITNAGGTVIYNGTGFDTASRVFSTVGNYRVTFTATNASAGCIASDNTAYLDFSVSATPLSPCTLPTLSAVSGPATFVQNNTATFSVVAGNYHTAIWTITDAGGNIVYEGTGINTASQYFSTPGNYKVTFTATNASAGCIASNNSAFLDFTVTATPMSPCSLPTLSAITGPAVISTGSNGTFSVTAGNYHSAVWKITDGGGFTIFSGSGITTTQTFTTVGNYRITFIATNSSAGCTPRNADIFHDFTVSVASPCSLPVVSAVSGPATIVTGASGAFSITASNYQTATWNITNSGGAVVYNGTGITTGSQVFNTAGVYKVTFTATNASGGCTASTQSASLDFTVGAITNCPTPTLSLVSGPTMVALNNTGDFSVTAGSYTSIAWTVKNSGGTTVFSGASTSTSPQNYTVAGVYTATFTATNASAGCIVTTNSVSKNFEVVAATPITDCSRPGCFPALINVNGTPVVVSVKRENVSYSSCGIGSGGLNSPSAGASSGLTGCATSIQPIPKGGKGQVFTVLNDTRDITYILTFSSPVNNLNMHLISHDMYGAPYYRNGTFRITTSNDAVTYTNPTYTFINGCSMVAGPGTLSTTGSPTLNTLTNTYDSYAYYKISSSTSFTQVKIIVPYSAPVFHHSEPGLPNNPPSYDYTTFGAVITTCNLSN